MNDKEIIKSLIKTINIYAEKEVDLLRRIPFKDLSSEEQGKIIMNDVAKTFN